MAYYYPEPSHTFSEYLLVPGYTDENCVPDKVSLKTPLVKYRKGQEECPISLNIPMVSAIMQSVSNDTLAIALAKEGGISFIFGSQSIESQAAMVRKVKSHKAGFVVSASNLTPDHTLADVLKLKEELGFSTVAITEDAKPNGKLLGIVTGRDYRVSRMSTDLPVREFMTPREKLIVAPAGTTLKEANDIIWDNKLNALPIVFAFPHGDTVLVKDPAADYYTYVRTLGRDYTIKRYGPVKVRPSDKKDHYVKRCVASAGDTLEIRNGQVYVNSAAQEVWPGVQNSYRVVTNGQRINPVNLDKLGLNVRELWFQADLPGYPEMPLTAEMLEKIKTYPNVVSVDQNIDVYPPDFPDSDVTIFPFDSDYKWTRDNFGPLWIPEKGVTVTLTLDNLPLYERIITAYEGNSLEVRDGKIYVNGEEAQSYTFSQDYYFMMGDNRHNSLDSRYWGFVPEDHIVGKPALIWLSIDGNKKFPKNIRWRRFFKFV